MLTFYCIFYGGGNNSLPNEPAYIKQRRTAIVDWWCAVVYKSCRLESAEEAEEDTGGYCRADYSGHVRTHGVHEQVVRRVVLQAHVV